MAGRAAHSLNTGLEKGTAREEGAPKEEEDRNQWHPWP